MYYNPPLPFIVFARARLNVYNKRRRPWEGSNAHKVEIGMMWLVLSAASKDHLRRQEERLRGELLLS